MFRLFIYILTFAMEINQFDFSPFVRVPKMRINKDFLKGVKHDREYTDFNFLPSQSCIYTAINNVVFDFAAKKESFRQMLV